MHKKPADKFNSCDGVFFPDSFVTVIFHIVSNGIFIHTDDAVVADGNPVRILAQISKFIYKENVARCVKMGVTNLPSMYINGELKFSSIIPSRAELEAAIREAMDKMKG